MEALLVEIENMQNTRKDYFPYYFVLSLVKIAKNRGLKVAPSEDRTHDPWFTRPVL